MCLTASRHAKGQRVAETQIEFDVPAEMRDGTVPRADVYRPGGAGPWPVLLARLPYGKQTPVMTVLLDPLAAARRGFLVVIQDTRGRFASEGEWEPWTYEESDGYDTVRWAAGLPGSNGSVGMIGGSYFGNTQWMAALSKPPELKAIAPLITWIRTTGCSRAVVRSSSASPRRGRSCRVSTP